MSFVDAGPRLLAERPGPFGRLRLASATPPMVMTAVGISQVPLIHQLQQQPTRSRLLFSTTWPCRWSPVVRSFVAQVAKFLEDWRGKQGGQSKSNRV